MKKDAIVELGDALISPSGQLPGNVIEAVKNEFRGLVSKLRGTPEEHALVKEEEEKEDDLGDVPLTYKNDKNSFFAQGRKKDVLVEGADPQAVKFLKKKQKKIVDSLY